MNMLLQQGVTAQAEATPDAVAVVHKDTRLSYAALEDLSNRLAHLLRDSGCRRGDRVALLMPKSLGAIVAMLGTLKADAICVPLDPNDPQARLCHALELADCRCLVAAGPVAQLLRGATNAAALRQRLVIGWLQDEPPPGAHPEFCASDLRGYPATRPAYRNTSSDIAQILFTSGSTGMPKGVMITHDGVKHFLAWALGYFGLASRDRVSQHAPLRFDLSTFDIFGALWAGAELHLVPSELNLLPHRLAQFMRDSRLTQWLSVPSVLSLMAKFDVVRQNDFPALRRVLWAGEVLPTPTLAYWMRRLPHVRFTNLYGPTETTIASSFYTVPRCPDDPRAPIPIGTACAGEEVLVLDAAMRPVAPGVTGELYIRGAGLSPGYWRNPERTRAAFLPWAGPAGIPDTIYRTGDLALRSADGLLYFLGRADTQVKSRGYRIELGEIEASLSLLPGLQEAAVVAIPSGGFEGSLICCAYVPEPRAVATAKGLRKGLAALVPGYMLPARWMRYDALPRNASGKVDRPRLKEAFQSAESRRPSVLARSEA